MHVVYVTDPCVFSVDGQGPLGGGGGKNRPSTCCTHYRSLGLLHVMAGIWTTVREERTDPVQHFIGDDDRQVGGCLLPS